MIVHYSGPNIFSRRMLFGVAEQNAECMATFFNIFLKAHTVHSRRVPGALALPSDPSDRSIQAAEAALPDFFSSLARTAFYRKLLIPENSSST